MLHAQSLRLRIATLRPACTPVRVVRLASRRPRHRPLHVAADMSSMTDTILTGGALVLSVGLGLSVLFSEPRCKLPPGGKRPPPPDEDAGIRWAVMGVISCLPLFNWMAWVFGALQDEEVSRLYYWYAALYSLPLLHSGLDIDTFSMLLLITGAAHLQLERLSATEPEQLLELAQQLGPLRLAGRAAGLLRTGAASALGLNSSSDRAALPGPQGRGRSEESTPMDDVVERQLRDFDERMRRRDAVKRASSGSGSGGGSSDDDWGPTQ